MLTLLLVACGGPSEVSEPATPPADTPSAEEQALERAEAAVNRLAGQLSGRLKETMAKDGVLSTMEVCSDQAQAMTASVAAETGVKVGRSSLKLRNPANAGPDWVRSWLEGYADTPPGDVPALSEIAEGHARVVRPIRVQAPCLACHGTPSPEVATLLADRYPDDQATGYSAGDLRGVFWAEVAVQH